MDPVATAGTVALSTRTLNREQGGAVRVTAPQAVFQTGRFARRPTTFEMPIKPYGFLNSSGRTAVRNFGTPVG